MKMSDGLAVPLAVIFWLNISAIAPEPINPIFIVYHSCIVLVFLYTLALAGTMTAVANNTLP